MENDNFEKRFIDLMQLSPEELKKKCGEDIFKSQAEINKLKGQFHKILNRDTSHVCLYPECSEKSIGSHSIPRSLLVQLADTTNHVVMFRGTFTTEQLPKAEVKKVGVNEATTFAGLCAMHDCETFLSIDQEYSQGFNSEQQFLLCYRALLKEFFLKERQLKISKQIAQDVTGADKQGIASAFSSLSAYACYIEFFHLEKLKKYFDSCLQSRSFSAALDFHVREVDKRLPIAACSMFTPERDMNGKLLNNFRDKDQIPNYVFLNIVPSINKSYILGAVLKEQADELNDFISPLRYLNEDDLSHYLSSMVLRYIENFIVDPEHWSKFSEVKKKNIAILFNESFFSKEFKYCEEQHNLFVI